MVLAGIILIALVLTLNSRGAPDSGVPISTFRQLVLNGEVVSVDITPGAAATEVAFDTRDGRSLKTTVSSSGVSMSPKAP